MLEDYFVTQDLASDLSSVDGMKIKTFTKLDLNVYKLESESESYVARIYHGEHSRSTVEGLSRLLTYLSSQKYPAEELLKDHSILQIHKGDESYMVLLTMFIAGEKPPRGKETFYRLGSMLGRLHSLPTTEDMNSGGTWHHLSLIGGLEEECDAAIELLQSQKKDKSDEEDVEKLCEAVRHVRDITKFDLPKCLVHPDFVPSNIIVSNNGGEWIAVDWAGAGIGLRVMSLGFLLGVAAIRGKIGLVNVIMKSYGSKINLEPVEVEVMHKAAYARFLTILAWEVGVGRKNASEALKDLPIFVKMGEDVAKTVKDIMSSKA